MTTEQEGVRAFVGVRVVGKPAEELVKTRKRLEGVLPKDTKWERGGYPADFSFHPHITIARFPDMTEEEGARIREALVAFRKPLYGLAWPVGEIDVLCSVRRFPRGVQYKSLWAGVLRSRETSMEIGTCRGIPPSPA